MAQRRDMVNKIARKKEWAIVARNCVANYRGAKSTRSQKDEFKKRATTRVKAKKRVSTSIRLIRNKPIPRPRDKALGLPRESKCRLASSPCLQSKKAGKLLLGAVSLQALPMVTRGEVYPSRTDCCNVLHGQKNERTACWGGWVLSGS